MNGGAGEFDGNGYRKRVLAAVEKRGGPEASDPFELYDLPPADDLDDAAVAGRVAEVWGFWQRQRDHPKYRVLVALLVEGHAARSAELLDAGRRRTAAARVRAQREQRDGARFALLDAAVARLVSRYGGVPGDKVEGLHELGVLAGLGRDEVATRLRRHRVVDVPAAAPEPGIGTGRRRQVRALLDEFGRLTDGPAPPSLLGLLGLEPGATTEQVRARTGAWRSRARELPPGRLRAVVDELLVHVAELLEPGRAAVETYLDAVAADVIEHLRPRVRAAVLVEDRLVAEDHDHLLGEATALGLDRPRATAVLAALAAELGTKIESAAESAAQAAPVRATPSKSERGPRPPRERNWQEPLRAARAALRAGRPAEAGRRVADAERLAGPEGRTQVRAVADEVTAVLTAAEQRWRAAAACVEGRRFIEALDHLENLERTATDAPGQADHAALLDRARAEVAKADAAVASALAGREQERSQALLAVLTACPDHPGALAALAAIPVAAPTWVQATRDTRGDVVVLWAPSATAGVTYKVSRQRPDGSWQVLGRVSDTSMEDGGAPAGLEAPVYAVTALGKGRSSQETRSDPAPVPGTTAAPPVGVATVAGAAPVPPSDVRAERIAAGSVRVSWTGRPGDEYRVRCLGADGRWRVVGRTTATTIEDGGAVAGPVPVYAVSAAVGGARSEEIRSHR